MQPTHLTDNGGGIQVGLKIIARSKTFWHLHTTIIPFVRKSQSVVSGNIFVHDTHKSIAIIGKEKPTNLHINLIPGPCRIYLILVGVRDRLGKRICAILSEINQKRIIY